MEAAKRMSMDVFAKIFDLYAPAIYDYAFRLCPDPLKADQIVGSVFTRLAEHLSMGHGSIINVRVYLYELAYHLVINEAGNPHYTALTKAVGVRNDVRYLGNVNPEDWTSFDVAMRAILNDLTVDQRHVVILRFMEGFSLKETASILGKTVNNVKVIQNRALASLGRVLGYPIEEINVTLKSFNFSENFKSAYPPELFAARRASPMMSPGESIGQGMHFAYH
jgi:RNA polymerase sigma-70 factor (ECF subfamily)